MAGKMDYQPNDAGLREVVRSEAVGQAVAAIARVEAASVEGATVRQTQVTVLGRWGGQRAGAVVESAEAPVRDLVRLAERIERGNT